jgi:hypothetical protein
MKNIFLTLIFSLISNLCLSQAYSTCALASAGIAISSGGCINNQTFTGSVNMAGLCVGGNNPAIHIKFVAGSCSQFTITPTANIANIGTQILTTACSGVVGTTACHENVIAGVPFMADAHDNSGNYLLTPGTTYVLRIWGAVGTSTFNICYNSGVTENPSNECSGAFGLGTLPTQFYNGGDCSFTGSGTDATTSDPAASGLCAGSLENTQWIKFQPLAGVSTFQIIGSSINCTGGGCGFQFGIFSGSCGSLISEGCYGNKVCSGGQSVSGPTNVSATDGFSIAWSGTSTTGFTATITKTGGGNFIGTEVFYLVMDGNADADCQYTLQGTNLQALPIELISFEGHFNGELNVLQWSCATEINNDYFSLERSDDGVSWGSIVNISGVGNSNLITNYSYYDNTFLPERFNYYRLKQVDFDGSFKYFDIIAINNMNINKPKLLRVYNILGNKVDKESTGLLIYEYSDGSFKKTFVKD